MLWDVFVRVIDNHGDAGVCWRLCNELAARGERARLWIDDGSALAWMAPGGRVGVEVLPWSEPLPLREPGDVVIEAFGCELPEAFVDAMAARGSLWLNLEYLTAEAYAERSHGLRSPVRAGIEKFFFYPGFSERTGGLLREHDLPQRQSEFDAAAWLRGIGIEPGAGRRISLFCYEPPALPQLLQQLATAPEPTQLLVTAGRAAQAVRAVLPGGGTGNLGIAWLPLLSQRDYDHLLWSCDLNFVRGEDSLVRALWAGRPFVWQLYPQADGAHVAKLEAFLTWLNPAPGLAQMFRVWNGVLDEALPALAIPLWKATAEAAQASASALPELTSALMRFAEDRGRI